MNNLKIVYKKPTEYDNSTISISSYDYNTESDPNDEELLDQNIKSTNTLYNTINKSLNQQELLNTSQDLDNYTNNSDEQFEEFDQVVTILKNNIINYKNKEEIIKYIDNFFTINKFSEQNKNIILLKLNESITKPVKLNNADADDVDKENKNDIKKLETLKTLSNDQNNLNKTDSKNSTKMFGLDINLWGIICIIMVLLFLYTRKKSV